MAATHAMKMPRLTSKVQVLMGVLETEAFQEVSTLNPVNTPLVAKQ
jgi:hypothetical protein